MTIMELLGLFQKSLPKKDAEKLQRFMDSIPNPDPSLKITVEIDPKGDPEKYVTIISSIDVDGKKRRYVIIRGRKVLIP